MLTLSDSRSRLTQRPTGSLTRPLEASSPIRVGSSGSPRGRGLSRFDGQRFLTYGVPEGLPTPSINHLVETSRGAYWVATNGGGVCRLNTLASGTKTGDVSASRFLACAVGETPEVNRVNVLYEDRAGQIWAGTDGGLFRLSEQSGKAVLERVALKVPSRPDRALQIWAFAEDSNGSLWVGTSSGLARRRNDGRTAHYSIQPLRGFDQCGPCGRTAGTGFG